MTQASSRLDIHVSDATKTFSMGISSRAAWLSKNVLSAVKVKSLYARTKLFYRGLLLEVIGWLVAQFGVQTHFDVEADNVFCFVAGGVGVVSFVALSVPSIFKFRKKAFR